jgi:excisionase family DNA binding protein
VTDEDKLYSPLLPLKEAADHLGVSLWTLRQWIQLGRIESHKLYGRRLISEDEICRLIDESRIPAISGTRPRVKSVTTSTRDRAVCR